MGVLGRGLASLIPKRKEDVEDMLEEIDSMDVVDEDQLEDDTAVQEDVETEMDTDTEEEVKEKSSMFADLDELGNEEVEVPAKAFVTPLPIESALTDEDEEDADAETSDAEDTEFETDDLFADLEKVTAMVEDEPSADEDDDDESGMAEDDVEMPQEEKEIAQVVVKSEQQQEEPTPPPGEVIEEEQDDKINEDEPVIHTKEKIQASQVMHSRAKVAPKAKPAVKTAPVSVAKAAAKVAAVDKSVVKQEASVTELEDDSRIWDKHEDKIEHITIGDIHINPLQPRRTFDEAELTELRESISQHGILQPLVVRRLADGEGYELIAGERRLRAAKLLQWEKVPCVVRKDVKSDQSRLVFALIENIQRQNLNPIEEALAYKQLNEEYGLTHEEIGHRVGRSRVGITNIVRILQLPAEIQRGLIEGKITMGHARAILMIPDEDKQVRFYQHLLDEGLTVRKAETRARRIQRAMNVQDPLRKRTRYNHPYSQKYGPVLEERYGHDARIQFLEDKNRFEITFRAYSEAEMEELVSRLMGKVALPESNLDHDVIED